MAASLLCFFSGERAPTRRPAERGATALWAEKRFADTWSSGPACSHDVELDDQELARTREWKYPCSPNSLAELESDSVESTLRQRLSQMREDGFRRALSMLTLIAPAALALSA